MTSLDIHTAASGMTGPHLKFHHLGLAVRKPEPAMAFLAAQGYQVGRPLFDPGQNVNAALCTHEAGPAIEIIWPGTAPGPIDRLVQRHASGIIYHACYATDDLAAALAKLAASGLAAICISPPQTAPLFGGRMVSFYNLAGIGLVEILE